MPDITVATPAAAVPADRLTLFASEGRCVPSSFVFDPGFRGGVMTACMAEE